MNQGKQPGKRGRPRRKASGNSSSGQSFSQRKPGKKNKKNAPQSLRKIDSQSKIKKKQKQARFDYQDDSDGDDPSSSSKVLGDQSESVIKITLEPFKSDKVFAQILNRANKQPQFLIMLKNLLSGCYRSIQDKKGLIQRKWKQLRNSNCTQDEYLSRDAQLKKMQAQDIRQMQEDTMHKLSCVGIKGFQTKQMIIDAYRQNHSVMLGQYRLQEASWQRYHEEQFKLLNLLMKENDFVSQDYSSLGFVKQFTEDKEKNKEPTIEQNEMDLKFNSLETEENPQATQFHFCKYYKDINYDKVFDSSFKIHQTQKFYMDTKAMSWLLQSKCDQIYTNQRFQKETYFTYIQKLQDLYAKPQTFNNSQVIDEVLELTAYVLNSVHYYQKFKLKCDLLHPLDLLLVLQKVVKDRNDIVKPQL